MGTALQPYLSVAVEILDISIPPGTDAVRWLKTRWEDVAKRLDPTVAKDKDSVGRILAGNYKLSKRILAIFHEVLGLRAYGIPAEGTWTIIGKGTDQRLVMSSDAFADLLREKRKTHGDPMRWFEKTSNFMLDVHVEAISPLNGRQVDIDPGPVMFNTCMEEAIDRPEAHFTVPEGSKARISMGPKAEGHVIVLTSRDGSDEYASIHPWLSGSEQRKRSVRVFSKPIPANNGAGVRNLIAVNWPATLPLADHGLEDLFLRPDKKPQKYRATADELRTIGVMAYETRNAPFHERVHVDWRTLEIIESTQPGKDGDLVEPN